MKAHALVGCLLAAIGFTTACDGPTADQDVVDVDLEAYGVDVVVRDGAHNYRFLDVEGVEIGSLSGSIDADTVDVTIAIRAERAELAWSPTELLAGCDGARRVLASSDGSSGGWTQGGAADAIERCTAALAIGRAVVAAEGGHAPWSVDPVVDPGALQPQMACETRSTWVWGSSCGSCYGEAQNHACGGCDVTNRTCDSGATYTTCSVTRCSEQMEQQQVY